MRLPTTGGTTLAGVLLGSGRTGVVLMHQTRGDVCQLAWYGRELAAAGYRALLIDFTGDGVSDRGSATPADDAVAAATFLRAQGVARVVLIGASKGAVAAVGAGPSVQPPVLAVVALSPPAAFMGVDGVAAAGRTSVPELVVAARDDGQFPADAQRLHAALPPSPDHRLLLVGGPTHGVAMLRLAGTGARAAVDAFLAAVAPV